MQRLNGASFKKSKDMLATLQLVNHGAWKGPWKCEIFNFTVCAYVLCSITYESVQEYCPVNAEIDIKHTTEK